MDISMNEKNLKFLNKHCSDFSQLFYSLEPIGYPHFMDKQHDWGQVGDYLSIAAGIFNIEFLFNYYNRCDLCTIADNYDDSMGEKYSKIVVELTLFMFIWASLEALIDLIISNTEKEKEGGKIKAACTLLEHTFINQNCLPFYDELLKSLKEMAFSSEIFRRFIINIKENQFNNTSGEALELIYKIRNSFAHGFLKFSIETDNAIMDIKDDKIINLSSKLTLISMQMLLLAYFRKNNYLDKLSQKREINKMNCLLQSIHYEN